MKLKYNNVILPVTTTTNQSPIKYRFQKLYYAITIKNCNRYSSIANKQRIDVALCDDQLTILALKLDMHENTVFENSDATTTILLPKNSIANLELGQKFTLEQ